MSVHEENGLRIITEIKTNDDGSRVKVFRKVRLITTRQKANSVVADRKKWSKFGSASSGKASFDDGITSLGDVCELKLFSAKENISEKREQEAAPKPTITGSIVCRTCKGEHWTTKCPYKDTLQPLDDLLNPEAATPSSARGSSQNSLSLPPPKPGSYVPRSKLEMSSNSSLTRRQQEDETTIRIANLSDDTTEYDVRSLCEIFGPLARIFLSRDKETGRCKGFAFVCFRSKEHAARAIEKLNGHGFDNLILHVEWANQKRDNN